MSFTTMPKDQQNSFSPVQKSTPSTPAQKELWEAIKTIINLQNHVPPLEPVSRDQSLPLSFPQQRLWFAQQLQPEKASAYNMPFGVKITGDLDVYALEQSLSEIINRHESLRTVFVSVKGKPEQISHNEGHFHLSMVDLRSLTPLERETKAQSLVKENIETPFDLATAPLMRGIVIQLEDKKHLLVLTVHHIVMDAWSKGVLFQELANLYASFSQQEPSSLPNLSIQYPDFAVWQRKSLDGEFENLLLKYWRGQLDNKIEGLKLPCDRLPNPQSTGVSSYQKLLLPPQLTKAIKTLSRKQGATLFSTLLAAFQVLLHCYTQQNNIFVCSPIANRNQKHIKKLIGYFVNLLILRTDIEDNISFQQFLAQVRKVAAGGFAHQDLPIQQLINSLNLRHTPLSQVMFALQNTPIHTLKLPGLNVEMLDLDSGKADFDLYLYLIPEGDTLAACVKYNRDLFDETTMVKMLGHYQTILENIVTNPELPILSLLPLTEAEKQELAQKRNRKTNQAERVYIAPRNQVEIKLAEIWQQVLGIDSIGVKDSFFDLGGQSFQAMNLFAQIEDSFGKTLPLATLFQGPTIEQLAQILTQDEKSQSWSELVPIKPEGSKPPFFCIHGQQGNVMNLRELARYLDADRPFYGLQARGLDGKQLPCFRIKAMATNYIEKIRAIQPNGPYFLGGNSMGGTIALEMTQQLQQQGEEVALLAMFDSFNKGAFSRLSFRQEHYFTYLWELGLSKSLVDEIKEFIWRKCQHLHSKIRLSFGHTLPNHLSSALVSEANMQAKRTYNPQLYNGKIILFRAQEPAKFSKNYLPTLEDWYNRDLENGWGDIAQQGLEIHDVPGHHYSIFESPHVQTLAEKLSIYLPSDR